MPSGERQGFPAQFSKEVTILIAAILTSGFAILVILKTHREAAGWQSTFSGLEFNLQPFRSHQCRGKTAAAYFCHSLEYRVIVARVMVE
jgi:hypothetical protein